jgi:HPt (histidine-containing phosphotransfer) domain-containing protein
MKEQTQTDQKVANLDYLVALSKGDNVFVKEMIRIFLDENPNELVMLEKGIEERDLTKINVAAHKLRSTAPFVGIDKLIGNEIQEIEDITTIKAATKKIEIQANDNPEIQKIEIVTTDSSAIEKIRELFIKVKDVCEKAREELLVSPLGV